MAVLGSKFFCISHDYFTYKHKVFFHNFNKYADFPSNKTTL